MFRVVEHPLRTIWVPVDYTNATAQTLYVGQLVNMAGVINSKAGAFNFVPTSTPVLHAPFGVVVGTNNKEPLYSSTYQAEYITSVRTAAAQAARKWSLNEGMFIKGDPQALVQIAVIGQETILEGDVYNATAGTAPTEAIVTTGASTTTFTCATSGFDFTNVAYESTYFCRSGANQGIYRSNAYDTNAGTGAKTFYGPDWPYTVAVGDTFVGVNCTLGLGKMVVDALGMFIDCGTASSTRYVPAMIYEIDLRTKGRERVIFSFNTTQVIAPA